MHISTIANWICSPLLQVWPLFNSYKTMWSTLCWNTNDPLINRLPFWLWSRHLLFSYWWIKIFLQSVFLVCSISILLSAGSLSCWSSMISLMCGATWPSSYLEPQPIKAVDHVEEKLTTYSDDHLWTPSSPHTPSAFNVGVCGCNENGLFEAWQPCFCLTQRCSHGNFCYSSCQSHRLCYTPSVWVETTSLFPILFWQFQNVLLGK